MQRLAIVVVTRNSSRYLGRCLEAVGDRRAEIVVVDPASDDGSPELGRRRSPTELHCGAVSAAEGEH